MKLKIILVLTFLFILTANVQAVNYPKPFIEGDHANIFFIVPSNDIDDTGTLAAADIGANLQSELAKVSTCNAPGCGVLNFSEHSIYYHDNETGFENKNIISVGLSCVNKVSNSILGLNPNCSNFQEKIEFKEGYMIKVVQSPYNSSKIVMVVLATNKELLTNATKYIQNNKPSTDVGTEIKEIKQEKQKQVDDSQLPPQTETPSFFQRIVNWFKRLFGFG